MAKSKAQLALKKIMERIQDVVDEIMSPKEMTALAAEALEIIIRRTRLGYGVPENYGRKEKFPALSEKYIERRKVSKNLSGQTSPKKSNLTNTGQFLDSIGIKNPRRGRINIAPDGTRDDGLKNSDLKVYLEDRHQRYFLYLSELEFNQLVRIYRKTYGDLLKKKKLLR